MRRISPALDGFGILVVIVNSFGGESADGLP
jgi:hypothetical protein